MVIGMNINYIIGSGVITTPGIIWKAVKSPVIVLLIWFIGGIVAMSGSLTYTKLGVIHRESGGETLYLKNAYPKFMMSYLFSFVNILAVRPGILCAILQSAAQYFWYTIMGHRYDLDMQKDSKDGWHLPFSPFWVIKLTAVFLLFIITVYHMPSNKWANYINQTLAVIKLITYSIIAIAGIVRLFSNWSMSRINWQQQLSGNTDITAYSTSILLVMFSYEGWNTLNYSLDEFQRPERNLIFSNSTSVGIVTLVYLLVNIAFISVVPGRDIILNSDKIDETIAATFFRQLFNGSEIAVRIFTGLVVLSVMGTAASGVWSGSRIIVAAAKSDYFPKPLKVLENCRETPINALLAQFIWCLLIILFVGSSFTISSFTLFSTFSMYSAWIFYFATGIGLLVIRHKLKKEQEQQGPLDNFSTEWNYFKVLIPTGIFILAGSFILTFSFVVDDNHRIEKLSPIFISYGFLFIALLFYLFCRWKDYIFSKFANDVIDNDRKN